MTPFKRSLAKAGPLSVRIRSAVSYVLYTAPTGTSDKLELKHRGPYQVVNKLDSIYTIQDSVDGKLIATHINNLREFLYDSARTHPLHIDSILEQRGDRQRRSTMMFKVRWLGYRPEHDTWKPYKTSPTLNN